MNTIGVLAVLICQTLIHTLKKQCRWLPIDQQHFVWRHAAYPSPHPNQAKVLHLDKWAQTAQSKAQS